MSSSPFTSAQDSEMSDSPAAAEMMEAEEAEEEDSFVAAPLHVIETAPHPPRDTMASYPQDILPPLQNQHHHVRPGSISSTSSSSPGSGTTSGTTSPGSRSPLHKAGSKVTSPFEHPQHLDGRQSPRRRGSASSLFNNPPASASSSFSFSSSSPPSSTTSPLPTRPLESPSRSPQANHGSFLHHEHSTPALMDLPPSAFSGNLSPFMSSSGPLSMRHSSANEVSPPIGAMPSFVSSSSASSSSSSSPASASPSGSHSPGHPLLPSTLNLSALSNSAPFTPSALAATLPSLSARRNSKPLLWAGANSHFKALLNSHTVAELIQAMPKQNVVEIDASLSPYEGFEVLLMHNILAAPVYDSVKKEYTGFLDVRDLVSSVIFAHEEQLLQGGTSWTETWMDIAKKGLTKYEKLGSASITYLSRRSPFRPVSEQHSLMDVAKALATRVHRVPVIASSSSSSSSSATEEGHNSNNNNKCIYILSQSSLINFFIQHKSELSSEWKQSIGSLSLGLCKVISVSTDATAWTSFKLIEVSGVSGIAVVDREGRLVGNTSAKDLKLFMLDRGNLSLDQLILTYLANIRQREMINEAHPSCSVPVQASIGHVIELMAATKYHRVFITDKEERCIGVISLSDVLKFAVSENATSLNLNHSPVPRVLEVNDRRGSFNVERGGFSLSGSTSPASSQRSMPSSANLSSSPIHHLR